MGYRNGQTGYFEAKSPFCEGFKEKLLDPLNADMTTRYIFAHSVCDHQSHV
jgi:hypothetical protein